MGRNVFGTKSTQLYVMITRERDNETNGMGRKSPSTSEHSKKEERLKISLLPKRSIG